MPDILTIPEVASYLRVSARTIYRLIDRKELNAVRIGRQWRIPRAALPSGLPK